MLIMTTARISSGVLCKKNISMKYEFKIYSKAHRKCAVGFFYFSYWRLYCTVQRKNVSSFGTTQHHVRWISKEYFKTHAVSIELLFRLWWPYCATYLSRLLTIVLFVLQRSINFRPYEITVKSTIFLSREMVSKYILLRFEYRAHHTKMTANDLDT